MFKQSGTLAALGLCGLLAACGGNSGGGGSGATGSTGAGTGAANPGNIALAEGAWSGSNSVGNSFDLLVLEDGSLYALYGSVTAGGFLAAGFDVGSASVSGSTLSAGITQYDYAGHRVTGTVSATVVAGVSINGSAAPTGGTGASVTTFSATPLQASYAGYNYQLPAAIADIAGAWNGAMLDGSSAAFSIDAAGHLSGTNLGCSFTGTVVPRPSGRNVFNVALHFGASPCSAANEDAAGVAVSYTVNGRRQLIAAVESSAHTKGAMLFSLR